MADTKRYQVISACVIVPTRGNDGNEYLSTIYAPGVFDADPQHPRIAHNLESGYITELGAKAAAGTDASGAVMTDNQRADGAEPGSPVVLNDPGVVNELQQARAAAAAKLPTDGSAPDGRASQAVWVEYLAAKGYSYDELASQDKAELQKLAKQQS